MERKYSSEITPDMDGSIVQVAGWVYDIRDLGGLRFVLLRDREGSIQVTLQKKNVSKGVFDTSSRLGREWVVKVRGTVRKEKKAPNGYEIIPEEIEILNPSESPLPLDTSSKVGADLDTRLDNRVIDLRRAENRAIFRIRSKVLSLTRRFLESENFIEINTPKLVASATEGGTELFPISYFEREAFLGQSPQLYKQMIVGTGLDRVYEIGPIFRAEEHNTTKHLNEAISIDVECAFADEEDVMGVLERLINYMLKNLTQECRSELTTLKREIEVPKLPFERVTYSEAIDILQSRDIGIEWGEDLPTVAEKELGKVFPNHYFITEWPSQIKPFYTMPKEGDERICYAFDLMFKEIELASGTRRVHKYDLLKSRIEKKGLNPENFAFYLKAFRYGMPPHAGWGLGLERLLMVITGVKNIREVVLFPRDRKRITP